MLGIAVLLSAGIWYACGIVGPDDDDPPPRQEMVHIVATGIVRLDDIPVAATRVELGYWIWCRSFETYYYCEENWATRAADLTGPDGAYRVEDRIIEYDLADPDPSCWDLRARVEIAGELHYSGAIDCDPATSDRNVINFDIESPPPP